MPWKETTPMNQKVMFIADYLQQRCQFAQLCRLYKISRKTGYKWINRYNLQGVDGLWDQSRKPNSHPSIIPHAIRHAIIEIRRTSKITLGAAKIQARLKDQFPDIAPPAISTINKILATEGLTKKRQAARRVPRDNSPLDEATQPNQLWTTDFKGQFKLANGQWCYPLTLMDQCSRYLLGCESQKNIKTTSTLKSFQSLFREYGLPERIRSDNGNPFASKATAGLSKLSIWWIKLGIIPERIQPGRPQQNGKHERMHRTLKQDATQPPASSFATQQKRFDDFKRLYNEERPHESLNMKTPAEVYQPSARKYSDTLRKVEYPSYFDVRKVRGAGVVYWNGGQLYISHLLSGESIGMNEIEDGIFDVYFSFYRLGQFDIRDVTKGSVEYWSLKV